MPKGPLTGPKFDSRCSSGRSMVCVISLEVCEIDMSKLRANTYVTESTDGLTVLCFFLVLVFFAL